jgi:hypothetical protein
VFNWGMGQWKRQYEAGEEPSALELKKHSSILSKAEQ